MLGMLALALGCKPKPPADDDVVARVTIETPAGHWAREGFVPMVPPVRLPGTSTTLDDVTVWLALPEDGIIHTRVEPDGQVLLEFPPGTRADRVESRGALDKRVVVDVRGTRIAADGAQWMHTYRRAGKGDDTSLFGYAWPRDDAGAHDRATQALLDELAERPPVGQMSADKRQRYLASIERKNECAGCHSYARPANAREGEHGLVNRGTDLSGFFVPQTVLMDSIPLERYGKLDPNLEPAPQSEPGHDPEHTANTDPRLSAGLTLSCPKDAKAAIIERRGRVRAVCPDNAVPSARVDLHTLEPERARAVCRARRYLHEHLDAQGRQIFSQAIDDCASVTPDPSGT